MQAVAWVMATMRTETMTMKNNGRHWVAYQERSMKGSRKQKSPFTFNRIKNFSHTNKIYQTNEGRKNQTNFEQIFKRENETARLKFMENMPSLQQNVLGQMQTTVYYTFLKVEQVKSQNITSYPTNFTCRIQYWSPPVSSRFHYQSNVGNPSSRKPYYNTQSGLSNSNGILTSEGKKRNLRSKLERGELL